MALMNYGPETTSPQSLAFEVTHWHEKHNRQASYFGGSFRDTRVEDKVILLRYSTK